MNDAELTAEPSTPDVLAIESSRSESQAAQPDIVSKIEWLMFFRLAMFTVLLGTILAFDYLETHHPQHPQWAMLGLIVVIYLLTIVYAMVIKRLKSHFVTFAYAQLMIDLATSAVLVALTGGTESLFLFTFSLTVLAASLLLYRQGALYTSAVATGLVVLLVSREALGRGGRRRGEPRRRRR